jgi:hypothetical protein
MADVFGPRQDAESENGDSMTNSKSGFDVTRRPFSLGTFFWASKRKHLAREGETPLILILMLQRTAPCTEKRRAFAWRRVTFLCWCKEK